MRRSGDTESPWCPLRPKGRRKQACGRPRQRTTRAEALGHREQGTHKVRWACGWGQAAGKASRAVFTCLKTSGLAQEVGAEEGPGVAQV